MQGPESVYCVEQYHSQYMQAFWLRTQNKATKLPLGALCPEVYVTFGPQPLLSPQLP